MKMFLKIGRQIINKKGMLNSVVTDLEIKKKKEKVRS